MPKLPSLTPKKLITILKSFGFQLDHTTGSHFIFYNSKNKKGLLFLITTKICQGEP